MPRPTLNVELEMGGGVGWTSVTADVESIEIDRGANDDAPLIQYDVGEMVLRLRSPGGKYNPFNTSGPWFGELAHGMRVQVRGTWAGNTSYLFFGRVDGFRDYIHDGRRALMCELRCYDPLADLAGVPYTTAFGSGQLGVSAAIGAIVARAASVTGLSFTTSAGTGTTMLDVLPEGDNALSVIRLCADSDGGAFWCDPDGTLRYEARTALDTSSRSRNVQSTFGPGSGEIPYSAALPETDGKLIVSEVSITSPVGTATVTGPATYGTRTYKRDDVLCLHYPSVESLAQMIYDRWSSPVQTVREVEVRGEANPPTAWPVVLQRRIRDLVRVNSTYPYSASVLAWVIGVHQVIDKSDWATTFRLAGAGPWATQPYFTVGTSTVGGSDYVMW
jgi:hypothetical protein